MEITCYRCKTNFEVPAGTMLKARLGYARGHKEYAFPCPNCGAQNGLTADEFHSNDRPQVVVPVTGKAFQPGGSESEGSIGAPELIGRAPTNPVEDVENS